MINRNPLVRLFLVCAVLAAPGVLKTPSAMAKVGSAKRKTALAESRFATLDALRIHYVNYGRGNEAIVFIHGWTCNLNHWRQQLPEFAKHTRTIAIDLPGHGQSDKPLITYSMDLFARAVDAVLRDAKVSHAILVGHSMGTPVARQFYRKYPAKTLAIVIVDCPLRPSWNQATAERIIANFRGPDYEEALTQMFGAMMGPILSDESKREIMSSSLSTPQHVIVSALEAMADSSIWADDKINVPVLAILAKNPAYPPNIEDLYRGVAPNFESYMWKGVGHFLMMDRPKEFNKTVLAFLEKNELLKKKRPIPLNRNRSSAHLSFGLRCRALLQSGGLPNVEWLLLQGAIG